MNNYIKQSNLPNIRKMMHFQGYSFGWASYAQYYSIINYSQPNDDLMFKYNSLEYDYGLIVTCLIDIGVNVEGWTMEDTLSFLQKNYGSSTMEHAEIYFHLVQQVPTRCLQAYYSYFLLRDFKDDFLAKTNSSEKTFHTLVLDVGQVPLYVLKDYLNDVAKKMSKKGKNK